jgi:hypothetical protein
MPQQLTTNITNGYLQTNSTVTISGTSSNYSLSTEIANLNNMNRQVKVAVFTVERDDKGTITSSKFVKEFWVENKNGGSVVLAAAKQLDKDFDPNTTVIKEMGVVNF